MKLDTVDRRLLDRLQSDFPLERRPYQRIAEELGMSEEEVITRIRGLIDRGLVRRLGPIMSLKGLGGSSTLVAMRVPDDDVERVAGVVSEYREVSHNYLRPAEYNLWFTLSSLEGDGRLEEVIREIEEKTGYKAYNLPTTRKYKIGVRFDIAEEEG